MFGNEQSFLCLYGGLPPFTQITRRRLDEMSVYCRVDRIASEDITVSGLTIPKGHAVGILIYALHHDPQYWPEPDKFDPDRYS